MEKIERVWMRPELLILARSKPEEAVLAACKYTGVAPNNGPLNKYCGYVNSGNTQHCINSSQS